MSSVNKNKFRKLVAKYLNNDASEQEVDIVEKYYRLFDEEPDKTSQIPAEQVNALQNRLKAKISENIIKEERATVPLFRSMYFRAAAVLLLVSTFAIFLYLSKSKPELSSPLANATGHAKSSDDNQNRFVTLPDGTKVVLHGQSKISYDNDFNKTVREVTLTGEAYFDVVHLPTAGESGKPVPFIIKTGKVRTTVLGTAFNIKAWPDQKEVVVTVTRGKVKVQDSNKTVTVLTANKQVTLNTNSEVLAEVKTVKSEMLTSWTHKDMIFDAMPFGELAANLEKRYDVKIHFKNPAIKNCAITGRFSGTETLDEVFQILSLTSNTKYFLTDQELVVDGEKCY
ncbi:hypothetical protein DSL64_15875 [Dyadobacter luteus]|uniref:FecR family protein n=1 Tax=Dyadobacter luteus TaxID=2259619 RepID=A0A3D8YCW9_9BACT|nr:FecR domain-containing protein [Dyadobacter luteus]REA60151.1 hypothetical protein DSL64_15875 [Dyadobacter luteus]